MSIASSSVNELDVLDQSPAFAMSLGAKELFHTNFLAFLLETEDPGLDPIRRAIRTALGFPVGQGCVSTCAVWREKHNLDLVIVEMMRVPSAIESESASESTTPIGTSIELDTWDWDVQDGWHVRRDKSKTREVADEMAAAIATALLEPSGRVTVVEAKLKSTPRVDQLNAYEVKLNSGMTLLMPEVGPQDWSLRIGGKEPKKGQNVKWCRVPLRVLLSVGGKPLTASNGSLWTGVAWKALCNSIGGALIAAPSLGVQMSHTLGDYVKSLDALLAIVARADAMYAAVKLNPKVPYSAFYEQVVSPEFGVRRLVDLLGKRVFDLWLSDTFIAVRSAVPVDPQGWKLETYSHYSNGAPGFGIEFKSDPVTWAPDLTDQVLSIGVQVQGNEIRKFISTEANCPGLELFAHTHALTGSGSLWQDWFGTLVANVVPCGDRGDVLGHSKKPPRLTNLRVFNVQRFVFSVVKTHGKGVTRPLNWADVNTAIQDVAKLAAGIAPRI